MKKNLFPLPLLRVGSEAWFCTRTGGEVTAVYGTSVVSIKIVQGLVWYHLAGQSRPFRGDELFMSVLDVTHYARTGVRR